MKIPRVAVWITSLVIAFIFGAMFSPFHSDIREGIESTKLAEERTPEPRRILPTDRSADENVEVQKISNGVETDEFKSRIRAAFMQVDTAEQYIMLNRVFEDLDEQNLQTAISAIEELPDGFTKTLAWMALMRSWSASDSLSALDYSLNRIGGRVGKIAAREAMRVWAGRDPHGALAWAEEHDRSEGPFSLMSGVILGWATNNLSEAAAYTESLPEGPARKLAIEQIAGQYVIQGPDGMKDWIASLNDPDYKEIAMSYVARQWAVLKPEETANWLGDYIDADYAVEAVSNLVDRWALDSPVAAAEWLSKVAEGSARERGTVALMNRWFEADSNAVGEYLNEQPSSPFLDQAVDIYARRAAEDDPEVAITWTESILDPELRRASIIEVAQKWVQVDPVGATEWLEEQEIPPDMQEAIWNPPQPKEEVIRKWLKRRPIEGPRE